MALHFLLAMHWLAPIISDRGEGASANTVILSGFFLILLVLLIIPLFSRIKSKIKNGVFAKMPVLGAPRLPSKNSLMIGAG